MIKFTIKQEEVTRIKVFADHVSKLKNIVPTSNFQVFNIDGTKLEIFASGESGSISSAHDEIKIDILNPTLDPKLDNWFFTEIEGILKCLNKLSIPEISVEVTDNLVRFINPSDSNDYVSQKLALKKTKQEVEELRNYISNILASEDFANKTVLKIDEISSKLDILSNLTKIFNQSKFIEVSPTTLKTADNFGIFTETLKCAAPISATTIFHRDLGVYLNNISEFWIASNGVWYFKTNTLGIETLLVPPVGTFSFPSKQDLDDICPEDKSRIKLEINAKKFYETLSYFDNIFDHWDYNQIEIEVPTGFENDKILKFYWGGKDEQRERNYIFPVSIKERTDTKDDFKFTLSTKEIKELEKFFSVDDTSKIYVELSSAELGQDHGTGVKFTNDKGIEIIIPKMSQ